MRLVWTGEALRDLEGIAHRAPRAAGHVFEAVSWLARQPFPHAFRRVVDTADEHVLTVPPYVVIYALHGDELEVLTIEDSRRRSEPW